MAVSTEEWQEWHDMVKNELKRLFTRAEVEKPYRIGNRMSWGQLEGYRPDVTVVDDGRLILFEVETYYRQEKIMRFIVFCSLLEADLLVVVFSNQKDEISGWDGETRVRATEYLGKTLRPLLTKPVEVLALVAESPLELETRLKMRSML